MDAVRPWMPNAKSLALFHCPERPGPGDDFGPLFPVRPGRGSLFKGRAYDAATRITI